MHACSTVVMGPCRAALARSKGWAPRPLPQPQVQSTADSTAADNATTPVSDSAGSGSGSAAVLPLPWRDPGLRFTSAPIVGDDDGITNTRQAEQPEGEQKGMVAEQDQVRHDSAVNQMYQMYGEHSKASGSACMGMPGLVMQLVCFQVLGKLLLPSEARVRKNPHANVISWHCFSGAQGADGQSHAIIWLLLL